MSYNVKSVFYYVKKSGYLVNKACELVCKRVIMFNACFFFFLSLSFCPHTHGLILFKGYAVMFKMWVILSMKPVNLAIQGVIMLNGSAVFTCFLDQINQTQ